ncbi:hypothetical protein GCM10025782_03410 [Pedococcus ginsenosidimutans]|uniref:Camelysin metallo-endopeptidase n=1 Tax=Pedococcus ginsenosidimutans TaxID=490570 RepID=A0ABP8XQ84_9MICO
MAHLSRRQKIAASATALVLIGSGTAAFAYWSSTGMGSGTASTSTGAPNLTVTQASAPSGMAPGIDATAITATVTNNADSKAMVSQVVVSIASVTKALDAPAGTCDASDYTLSNPIMTVGAAELAKGGSTTFSGATLGFNNTAANQDGCKGATVHLAYDAS